MNTCDYEVDFTLPDRIDAPFHLTLVNDGTCAAPGAEKDKNVFVYAVTLAGPR